MTTRGGVGLSKHPNPARAARDAVEQARKESGIEKPSLVMVYATVSYPQEQTLAMIRELVGPVPIAGCSVEGTISQHGSVEENFTLMVSLIESDELRFDVASSVGLGEDSARVGRELGESLRPKLKDDAIALIMLTDGLVMNYDLFADALKESLFPDRFLPCLGGMAGDDWTFENTYQYINGEVITGGVVGVLMSGPRKMACSITHGCASVGNKHEITKADSYTIQEIDGRPALEVFKEYLHIDEINDWPKAVANVGIGLRASSELSKSYDEFVIRYVPLKNDEEGTIQIPTEISAGTSIWMMRRDHDKMEAGIGRIVKDLKEKLGTAKPQLVFQFDCVGRAKVILRCSKRAYACLIEAGNW